MGDWIDETLLGGAISHWGDVQGRYDSGRATKAELALAAANGTGQTVLLAVSAVEGVGALRAGAKIIAEKLAARAAIREAERLAAERAVKMATVRAVGKSGEETAGIIKNTIRIKMPGFKTKYRIPDELNKNVLGEVKKVTTLSGSSQMEDFVAFAKATGRKVNYYVLPTTVLTGKALEYFNSGVITVVRNLK